MEFFLTHPDVERLPPASIRMLDLHAEPYPDEKRLWVALDLIPFQQKPSLVLTLTDSAGEVVSTSRIIEPVAWRFELTLHIRKPSAIIGGVYQLPVILSFPDLGENDRRNLTVEIPSPSV